MTNRSTLLRWIDHLNQAFLTGSSPRKVIILFLMISIDTWKRWYESNVIVSWWLAFSHLLMRTSYVFITLNRLLLWSLDFLQELGVLFLLAQVDVECTALFVSRSRYYLVNNVKVDVGLNGGVLLTIMDFYKRFHSIKESWFVPFILNLFDEAIHLRKNTTTNLMTVS